MSIAEKLTTVAENVTKVYNAGYEKGKAEGGGDVTDRYDEGFADGKQAEYDRVWDDVQADGDRRNYNSYFAGKGWKSGTSYNPKYPIIASNNSYATSMFNASDITNTLVKITITGSQSSVFANCGKLKTVHLLDISGATGTGADWFSNDTLLENIEFEGYIPININFKSCCLMTTESLINIVEHLSPSVSGKTMTLNSNAVANADWSSTNYASWEDLVAQKKPSGWTITLTTA